MSTSLVDAVSEVGSGVRGRSQELSSSRTEDDPARMFEAYILRRMLSEMRPASGWAGGGIGGDTFSGMFEEAIADELAKAGGLGIAEALRETMEGHHTPGRGSAEDAIAMARLHEQVRLSTMSENSTVPPQPGTDAAELKRER